MISNSALEWAERKRGNLLDSGGLWPGGKGVRFVSGGGRLLSCLVLFVHKHYLP